MEIAILQLETESASRKLMTDKAVSLIHECRGADLVVLPELWNIGFMHFNAYQLEAEALNGPTTTAICRAAIAIGAWVHAGSIVEREGGRFYNTTRLVSPQGRIAAFYRKVHLFGYGSRETELLQAGEAVTVCATPWAAAGLATCYDLRFPELFRQMVDKGATFFLVCAAWPLARAHHWELLTRVRAMENQAFLIAANAAGTDHGTPYAGRSTVVDPWGETVAVAGEGETILRCTIDPGLAAEARAAFPALADRRGWLR